MVRTMIFLVAVAFLALGLAAAAPEGENKNGGNAVVESKVSEEAKVSTQTASSIYDFTVRDIDGKEVKLEQYRGKPLLIVNTASKCGFTPQYTGLEQLYEKYRGQRLVVLGFPANNFMGQEPGTNAEIKEFCSSKYQVTFPMFSKISVKGDDKHPLYRYLTEKETDPEYAGEITWNFNKFLIGKNGAILARFDSKTKPDDPQLVDAVEKALK